MFIDPHVHFRDGPQSYKETVKHGLSVAERAGMTAVFDMPNPDPPLTSYDAVAKRIELAESADSPVWYGVYVGVTAGEKQIEEAVRLYDMFDSVIGIKMYAGHSTGNMGLITRPEQMIVYKTLAKNGYKGVIAVHCEKESVMRHGLWDPSNPVSHAAARMPEAEITSVCDQIYLSHEAGFEGTLHIAHISVPEAVDIVNEAKKHMKITCGVTPHHFLLDLTKMEGPDGLQYKMNPPLRPRYMTDQMAAYLKEGKIDWIETDHAPHSTEDKFQRYVSGIVGLPFYPRMVRWLGANGFSEQQIRDLTFDNIKKAFGEKTAHLQPRQCEPDYNLAGDTRSTRSRTSGNHKESLIL